MINIKELERRWLKYKTKSFLLVSSIISILGTLIYGGYYILFKLDFNTKTPAKLIAEINSSTQNKKELILVKEKETKEEINSSIVRAKVEPTSSLKENSSRDEQLILTPIIPIIEEDKDVSKNSIKGAVKVKKERHIKRVYKVAKSRSKPKPKPTITKVVFTPEESKKPKISLKMTSENYMQIMKEKFAKSKNPKVALSIAKVYFRAGNYEKSLEWALKANSIDSKLEESWLLFAKSKQMLGEKSEALKILITYYKKSKSQRAKELIKQMKTESI